MQVTSAQDLEIIEVRILSPSSRHSVRSEFLELKNNSSDRIRIVDYFVATDKEELGEYRIISRRKILSSGQIAKISIGRTSVFKVYLPRSEKKTIYLGTFKDDEMVIIDSVVVPELIGTESYAKINGEFSKQLIGTPGHENWETIKSEILTPYQFMFGLGPNMNTPKGNTELNESSSFLPGYGFEGRFIYNLSTVFASLSGGYVNKYYRINLNTDLTTPAGTLSREVKGRQHYGQLFFNLHGGIHLTPRLSFSIGQGFGVNLVKNERLKIKSTFTDLNGNMSEESEDLDENKPVDATFLLSFEMKYFRTDQLVFGARLTRDQVSKERITQGDLRNRTMQLYVSYVIPYGRRRMTKYSIKRMFQ